RMGPIIKPAPLAAPNRAKAEARSAGVVISAAKACAVGMVAADNRPPSARLAMNNSMLGANPIMVNDRLKPKMPKIRTGLRPYRSDTLPQNGADINWQKA